VRVSFAIVIVGLVASCVSPESVQCADGSVCPRDRTCWLIGEQYQCVSDEQVAACEGRADLVACAGGTCFGGVCIAPSCGDGRVSPIEVCDDNNTASGDGCSPDCRSDETCGNGIVDLQVGEQCDDGAARGGLSHDGCSSRCLEEQPQWRTLSDYDELLSTSKTWNAVYDLSRGRVIVVAAAQNQLRTIEIEGGVWTDLSSVVAPAERSGFGLAYDAHRKRVVLFGGLGFRDTWEWDGARWLLVQAATAPPARAMHAMTYDPIRRRVVVFGGRTSLAGTNSELNDTWAWDGTTWIEIVGPSPSKRSDTAVAFDPMRGVIVLYGGISDTNDVLADTWELDDSTWTPRTSSVPPGPRREHSMAFDPVSNKVLAYGGREMFGPLGTTLAWDGVTWTEVANDVVDPGRAKLVTLANERRVMHIALFGSFEWNGAGWARSFTPVQGGVHRGRVAAAADLDHRRILVFGGYDTSTVADSTEIWRGIWMRHAGVSPPARGYAAMAYDSVREEFVMFGGEGASETLGDTWVWDGAWRLRSPSKSPQARSGQSMVFDAKRGVVVLFGGSANGVALADTWTWDGTTWTEVAGDAPPSRANHAATYDPIREETVIFGGYRGFGPPPLGDTWTWNGTWVQRSEVGPSPRFTTASAWDAARGRVVLFGGNNGAADFNDVWEWDGTAWTQVAATATAARGGYVLVSALDGAGVLRFGVDNQPMREDVVQLRWSTSGAREACVVGEDFDGDGHDAPSCGGGDPDCWRICAPLCPPGTSCPAGAPGCGDGTCTDGRETCHTCPADCGACMAACGDLACNGGETAATCAADCP
jgi:cysteine-rich repeat protein